ncbi:SH3 domain-containing protein, partial [Cutibacterium avidum]|uniref:SH3 domain-containing protein n=2 Tax=Cutibacterium avidum TaxID=33010 RepID=UPI003B50A1C8
MSASVATTVSRGTALTTTGRTTGIWTQVNYHGHNLWASRTYLTTTNPAPKPKPKPTPKPAQTTTVYTTANLNLRNGASMSASVATTVSRGTALTTTGRTTGIWTQVNYHGHNLWASRTYLTTTNPAPKPKPKPTPKPAQTTTVYTTANLNLRNGASMSASVATTVSRGTALTTTGRTTGIWTQVNYHGHNLWASRTYLTTTNPAPKPKPRPTPRPSQTPTSCPIYNLTIRNGGPLSRTLATTWYQGTALTTTGRTTGIWTQVNYHGHNLWASRTYLTTTNPAPKPKPRPTPNPAQTTTSYTTDNPTIPHDAPLTPSLATTVTNGTALTTTGRTTGIWTQVNHHGH